jgi:hypothetical protein
VFVDPPSSEIAHLLAQIAAQAGTANPKHAVENIRRLSLQVNLGATLVLVALWFLNDNPALFLTLGGGLYFPCCVFIAWNESRATPVMISPLSWWFAWQSFTLGLSPLWLGPRWQGLSSVNYGAQDISTENVALGFLYYAIGALALHFGLQAARPLPSAPSVVRTSGNSLAVLIALWGIGLVLSVSTRVATSLGMVVGPLQMGAMSAACSLGIAPPRSLPMWSPPYWGLLIVATLGCVGAQALIGLKFLILISVLPIFWVLILDRRTRSALLILIPALALSYIYVVEPVVEGLRKINQSAAIGDSLIEGAQRGTLGDVAATDQTFVIERIDTAAARIFPATYVSYPVQEVQSAGFRNGQTLEYLLYAFIPRVLWPNKPLVSRGAWMTVELGGAESEENAHSSSAITAEGELYWNFGVAGMVLGMAGLGWLISRLVWRQAGIDPRADPICMLALLITIFMVFGESEAGTLLVSVISTGTILYAIRRTYGLLS